MSSPGSRRTAGAAGGGVRLAGTLLEDSDRPLALGGPPRQAASIGVIRRQQQRPAVAFAELARLHQLERLVGKLEQAEQVRNRDPAATDAQADLLACEPELLDQGGARPCLLDRI